jgi:hypothetical protein
MLVTARDSRMGLHSMHSMHGSGDQQDGDCKGACMTLD